MPQYFDCLFIASKTQITTIKQFYRQVNNMLMQKKKNILFIDSEEELSSDSQKNTSENRPNLAIMSLHGSHRINSSILKKGFFVQSEREDYIFEQIEKKQKVILPLRQPRKKIVSQTIFDEDQSERSSNPQPELSDNDEIKNQIEESKMREDRKQKVLAFQFCASDNEIQQQADQQQKPNIELSDEQGRLDKVRSFSNLPNLAERKKILKLEFKSKAEKKEFVLQQVPSGAILETKIHKSNSAQNYFYSQFDMLFRVSNCHIISSKKQIGNLTCNYPLSLESDSFSSIRNNYLGKVRPSKNEKVYNVYNAGRNPTKVSENWTIRQILATVEIRLGNGPRRMEVFLLKEGYSYFELEGYSAFEQITLQQLYEIEKNRSKIHFFRSRKPEWVAEFSEYFLNFGGRVKVASVRNFILEDPTTGLEVLLFGKYCDNIYHFDISYPFTPHVALGILMAQFEISE